MLIKPFLFAIPALAAWILAGRAFAQAVPTTDAEEWRRRSQQEELERQRLQQAPNVRLQEEAPAPEELSGLSLPVESPCFRIDRFLLEVPSQLPESIRKRGASSLPTDPFHFAQTYLQQYAGQCIGREGLNLIVRRLTARILAKGYSTTRLGIPEQELGSGQLRLTLMPGVIRAIRFSDASLPGTWRTAFPARPGDLLNIRDLEQGLEQMKRVPSQDVAIQIVPGSQLGESDVLLTVKRGQPWRVIPSLEDSGSEPTGRLQAGLNLALDNPFGLSDLLSLSFNHDVDGSPRDYGTRGDSVTYSLPWGYWTHAGTVSRYHYHQKVPGLSSTHEASGESRNLDLRIARLVQRNQTQKNTLQFRTGYRTSRSYLDDTEFDVQRRDNSYAELAWVHQHYLKQAQFDATLARRQGVHWFGAQPDWPNATSDSPTFYYRMWTLDATLAVPFACGSQSFKYTGTVRGQYTSDPLYSTDFFSIGNRWTVRGFDGETTLAAEQGVFLRNELEIALGQSGQAFYLGLDGGRVQGPSARDLPGNSLVGGALGFRGTPFKGLYYDVFLGGPLHQPRHFRNRWPVAGFSLSYQL